MIRPREDQTSTEGPTSAEVIEQAEDAVAALGPSAWDVESLPPELEYFQRSEAY